MILDLIEKNKNITQREMSIAIGSAVSMVNNFLDEYEQKGYIKRKYLSTKTVEYFVTKKGLERRRVLNIGYLNSSQHLYNSAKDNIITFINQIITMGFRRILLYGAGEVAEIILQVIQSDSSTSLVVLGVVDDNPEKKGKYIVNTKVIMSNQIIDYIHDGILISSYTHHEAIFNKLMGVNYNRRMIIDFFDF